MSREMYDAPPMDDETIEGEMIEEGDMSVISLSETALVPSAVSQSLMTSQYETMVRLAHQFPRSLVRIHKACLREAQLLGAKPRGKTGSLAYYRFKMGDQEVEGISIWMAEAIQSNFDNCLAQGVITSQTGSAMDGGTVEIMAFFADAQKNIVKAIPSTFAIPPAPGRFKDKLEQADRWRSIAIRKAISIARRGAIERSVPRDLIDDCLLEAKASHQKRLLNGKSLDQVKSESAALLQKLGVTKEEAERYVDQPVTSWSVYECAELDNAANSIIEKRATVEAMFRRPKEDATKISLSDVQSAPATTPNQQAPAAAPPAPAPPKETPKPAAAKPTAPAPAATPPAAPAPAPATPPPPPAITDLQKNLNDMDARIIAFLKGKEPQSSALIVQEAKLKTEEWKEARSRLGKAGILVKVGEGKGSKYTIAGETLPTPATAPAPAPAPAAAPKPPTAPPLAASPRAAAPAAQPAKAPSAFEEERMKAHGFLQAAVKYGKLAPNRADIHWGLITEDVRFGNEVAVKNRLKMFEDFLKGIDLSKPGTGPDWSKLVAAAAPAPSVDSNTQGAVGYSPDGTEAPPPTGEDEGGANPDDEEVPPPPDDDDYMNSEAP